MTAAPTSIPARPMPDATDPPWNRLDRPALGPASTPVLATLYAVLSFGLIPAVLWPLRWAALLDGERPFYTDLVNGWRRRVAAADARQLDGVLAGLRPRPILVVLPWLAVSFAAALMGAAAVTGGVPGLVHLTYGYRSQLAPDAWPDAGTLGGHLHAAWVYGLSFAYACQWYAVRSHARTVRDLVRWTNAAARENGLPLVPNRATRLGLRPLWVVAGVVLCSLHAWWGVPMVLAGAIQRRYADVATPRLQAALSEQARGISVGTAVGGARYCPAAHCGGGLSAAARFCPRCGTAAVAGGGEG